MPTIAPLLRGLAALGLIGLELIGEAAAQDARLDAARGLILRGHADAARAVLEDLADERPDDPHVLFLLAHLAVQERDHARAVALYRRILVREPEATRVRLELARVLFRAGEDAAAEHHFRLALGAPDLPAAVRANVHRFLAAIRARQRWSVDAAVALAPDTNLNVGPAGEEVTIRGLPFRLSEEAQETSGVGLTLSLGVRYRAPLSERTRLRVAGSLWRAEYGGSAFDDLIASAEAGPQILGPDTMLGLFAVGQRRWYGGEPYSYAAGLKLEADRQFGDRWRLEAALERQEVWYDASTFRDGPVTSAAATLTYAVTSASAVWLLAGVTRERTEAPSLRNTGWSLGFGYHTELPEGFTFSVEPCYARFDHDEPDVLFGTERADRRLRVRTTIASREITFQGFMPTLSYVYTRNASNIDLHDYDRHQILAGVTRSF